jgi:DNA-binding transcriptional MocR family regulator
VAISVVPEPGVISFARGVPSPDMFPVEQLAECGRAAVLEHGRVALNYGAPGGYEPLREWIAARHGVTADRILVTPGSLIGLNLVVRAVCAGRQAIVEAPTYDRMLHALADAGATVATVGRGDDGLDLTRLADLAAAKPAPAMLYVLPTFHNPTGRTLDLAQRRALVEVAVAHDLILFEDDPYGLLRIEGDAQPSLHSLLREAGRDDLAIFASSFSKSVAPGLRVGYLVLPEQLVAPLTSAVARTYVSPPLMAQAQLQMFLDAGYLEPHLAALAEFLRPRRDALLDAFAGLPDGSAWTRPDGGYFLWLELPDRLDAADLNERAAAIGVTFVPGAGFFADHPRRSSARLAFSYPSVDQIRTGADRLVDLVRRRAEETVT